MRIFIGLVTPDQMLRRHFGLGKDAVVPPGVTRRGYFSRSPATVITAAYSPNLHGSARDLEHFLLKETRTADACVLLVDHRWTSYVANCRHAAFAAPFDPGELDSSLQNFFHRVIARTLRAFGQISAKFDRANDARLLGLPLRNFHADELVEIARLCREEQLSGTLSDDVEKQLVRLRARERPRKRSSFGIHYVVDDKARFYQYGFERHAQFATGGDHKPFCEINGIFRFGRKLDRGRHYNVSETENDTTSIAGDFPDCHDAVHKVGKTSHLNMFSNDYF